MVGKLSAAGGYVNSSCGLHIHVDARRFTVQAVLNLIALIAGKEKLIYKALGVPRDRAKYCKRINAELLEAFAVDKSESLLDLREDWYQESPYEAISGKYHSTRYHGINLHSMFTNGTIEFRLFNSTLDPLTVKTLRNWVSASILKRKLSIPWMQRVKCCLQFFQTLPRMKAAAFQKTAPGVFADALNKASIK